MPFRIIHFNAEGVRGINRPLKKDLQPGLTILYGSNGTGKTSVLQSIEWCLTGKLPYLKGPDFREEDAIVNLFAHGKTAKVTLIISDGKRKITVTRSRKMGKSTTAKSSLEVKEEGGERFEDEDGQLHLAKLLEAASIDFPRSVYLHQEAMHDLVSEDPEKRSEVIDRLLGTHAIRELIEVVDPKTSISKRVKELSGSLTSLDRDRAQFAVGLRRRLEERKGELLKTGYNKQELSREYMVEELQRFSKDLSNFATQIGLKEPKIEKADDDIFSISKSFNSADVTTTEVDRQRITALQGLEAQKFRVQTLTDAVRRAQAQIDKLGTSKGVTELEEERTSCSNLIDSLNNKRANLRSNLTHLTNAQTKLDAIEAQTMRFKSSIASIETRWANEKEIVDSLKKLEDDLEKVRSEFNRIGTLDRIVTLGANYIEETQPHECPICTQQIQAEIVVTRLRTQTSHALAERSKALEDREKEFSANIMDTGKMLDEYRSSQKELQRLGSARRDALALAETKIGVTLPADLTKEIEDAGSKLEDLDRQIKGESQRLQELDRRYHEVENSLSSLADFTKKLALEVEFFGHDNSPPANELMNKAHLRLVELDSMSARYKDEKAIDNFRGRLAQFREILNYLKSEEEVLTTEKDLPNTNAQIQEMKTRVNSLQELEASLAAIRQVALEYQKEAVTSELSSIEISMNHYYKLMDGHPVFQELQISVNDKKEPIIYSIMAMGPTSSTRISTRFSTAQENIVAFCIFLSNHDKLSKRFKTLIFDDPDQSMDPNHRDKMVQVIKELASDNQILIATQEPELMEKLSHAVPKTDVVKFKEWAEDGCSVE